MIVALFNNNRNLILELINVLLDGKQFILLEGVYEDFKSEILIRVSVKELKEIVKFRTEINTEDIRLMYSVR